MSAFSEEHRARFGVEPIGETFGVSASAYYERASGRRSAGAIEDERLLGVIEELHERNYLASLPDRRGVTHELRHDDWSAAGCV